MMRRFLGLVAFALGVIFPVIAKAQTDITPADVINLGVFHIESFSVNQLDGSIAFTVGTTSVVTGLSNLNLWTTPFDTASTQQITEFANETVATAHNPAWNQGAYVAYTVAHVPSSGTNIVPGPVLTVATNGLTGNLTPDGLHVESFTWGPDQSTIVMLAHDDAGDTGIYTVSMTAFRTGVNLRKILDCSGCTNPQFSASSDNVIAYNLDGDIHIVNPDGSNDHVAIPNGINPVWSQQTDTIAFICGTNICVANEDGSGRVQVTHNQAGLFFSEPAWSPDEAFVAMVGRASPNNSLPGVLYVGNPTGTNVFAMSTSADAHAPQWLQVAPQTSGTPMISSPSPLDLFYLCDRSTGEHFCLINSGFGVPEPTCDPTNCPGCCSQGVCFPGNASSAACGLGGVMCEQCSGGHVCDASGNCSNPTSCGIVNCPNGCCDVQNICHDTLSTKACGNGGSACVTCEPGEICDPIQGCVDQNPASCTGCSNSNGCQSGTQDSACGSNGLPCEACSGVEHCSTNRTCELTSASGCSISNCATGCCDVNGHCQADSDMTCGLGGRGCSDCTATGGEVCDKNAGTCNQNVSTCGPSSCPGCCDPSSQKCEGGGTSKDCGFSGYACSDCSTFPGTSCMGDAISGFLCE